MKNQKAYGVRREKKKSFFLRELSSLIHKVSIDEPTVIPLFVTRIELSKDGGMCYVYFSTHTDEEAFKKGLEILKLYKPSIRKALAEAMHARYVPNLLFKYDTTKDTERRVTSLLDQIEREAEAEES